MKKVSIVVLMFVLCLWSVSAMALSEDAIRKFNVDSVFIDPKTVVGMWLFDEGSGNTAADSSANGNDGELMNGPNWIDGKFNKALSFDGIDDNVSIANPLSGLPEFTYVGWVWIDSTGLDDYFPIIVQTGNGEIFYLPQTDKFWITIYSYRYGGPGLNYRYFFDVNGIEDKWIHLALTVKSDDTIEFYINGSPLPIGPRTADWSSWGHNYATIGGGRADWGSGYWFKGYIDEVAVFNKALTVNEINSIMEQGLKKAITGVVSKFSIGDYLKVINTGDSGLNIRRNEPTGDVVKVVPNDWLLKVIGGPKNNINGHNWWEIQEERYETTPISGWVAEDFLETVSQNTLTPAVVPDYFNTGYVQQRVESAINWAENADKNSREWLGYCLKFVSQAYGLGENINRKTTGWSSPNNAIKKLGDKFYPADKSYNPPRGALVLFSALGEYEPYGHIGIYLGDGKVIHAYVTPRINDLAGKDGVEQLPLIGSYIGWTYPPKEWFNISEDLIKLDKIINTKLLQQPIYPAFLLDEGSFLSKVITKWLNFTDWLMRVDLTSDYAKLYFAGIEYSNMKIYALMKARDFLNIGDVVNAKRFLDKADTYEKMSYESFEGAANVFEVNLEVAQKLAKSIKDGCQASVKFGLNFVSPSAASAADHIYDLVDLGIEYYIGDEDQAVKNFILKRSVDMVFNELTFNELDGKTLSDWLENRTGKYLFPQLSRLVKSEKWQWALSKVIKEAISGISEETLIEATRFIANEADKVINFVSAKLKSPAELRVLDPQGKLTGLINGNVKNEIPCSMYDNETVTIFFPTEVYHYEVAGKDKGRYGLEVCLTRDGEVTVFNAEKISTSSIEVHQFEVDWDILSQGGQGVTIRMDNDGDGIFEQTITTGSRFTSLNLTSGWNLISIPVEPTDTAIDKVLESISGHYQSVWAYHDGRWRKHIVGAPPGFNDLDTLETGKGYWINMKDEATLNFTGNPITDRTVMPKAGWNLVGYKGGTAKPTQEAISSIADKLISVWGYDNGWKRYIPGAPGNNLDTMEPGFGYWINVTADCVWDINAVSPAPKKNLSVQGSSLIEIDKPQIPYILYGELLVDGMKAKAGSEPAPEVVLKSNGKVLSSYRIGAVKKYGDFYVLEVPMTDNSKKLELYIQSKDWADASPIKVVPIGASGQLLRLDLSVDRTPEVNKLLQNYPNPFNPDTWIPYQLKEDANVEIRIYSMTGQLVRKLELGYKPAGFYTGKERSAYWDGRNEYGELVASGIYFYSIDAGDLTSVRKMLLIK